MTKIGILSRFIGRGVEQTRIQMVTERGNGYVAWNGKLYQSDIVRACIRPKVKAVGKLVGKHLRRTLQKDGSQRLDVNPEPYIRFLLEDDNQAKRNIKGVVLRVKKRHNKGVLETFEDIKIYRKKSVSSPRCCKTAVHWASFLQRGISIQQLSPQSRMDTRKKRY